MTKVALEENHSRWLFTSFTIICMVSTFALGWCLLKEFVYELLQSRGKDKLYGDIMHTGLIVCIFNISKFYLLLCFGKKLEIVDLVDSETGRNSIEENNENEDACEDDRDDDKGETGGQVIMETQRTLNQGLQREQDARENSVDLNIEAEQNQEEQNIPEIQDGQNLYLDGTNRQENEQVQGQISQDYGGSEERVLSPDDIKVHMHDSGNKNIRPLSTRDRKMSRRCRSLSLSEGQNYKSSRRESDQNIEPRKLHRSTIHRADPGQSKPSQKNKSLSNLEKTPTPYELRHRSCFLKKKP